MIYADQFPSAVGIFPFDAKELLQRFLFAVGKTQERFIRSDPAVNIDTADRTAGIFEAGKADRNYCR